MGFDRDLDEFQREDFSFRGNYRAIVENNIDLEKAGRVQVRIIGMHSPFATETPTGHLIWAEPCLGMYWSGGHNIKNGDTIPDPTSARYNPGTSTTTSIPPKSVTQLTPSNGTFVDEIEDDCGTGGFFTVPRKGTIVWIFFDSTNHNKAQYWATSPKQQDWVEQTQKITQDVNNQINNVKTLRSTFKPDKTDYKGNAPAQNASIQTYCSKPRINIYPIDNIDYQDITSFTSKAGTTFIVVNQGGKERYYVINKNTTTFVDEYGNRKTLVGNTTAGGNTINSNSEELVAGHHELHVVGDWNLFGQGNIFIQGDKNFQVNVMKNVGIVVKQGDADIIVQTGNVNLEVTKGNTNAHIAGNLQCQVDKDAIIKVTGNVNGNIGGNLSVTVAKNSDINTNGNTNVYSQGNIAIESGGNMDLTCQSFKLKAQSVDVNAPTQKYSGSSCDVNIDAQFQVKAGSSFKISPAGFGGDKQMSVPISNAFHTGTFPGPGAGPAISFPGVPTKAASAVEPEKAPVLPFIDSPKQSQVASDVTSLEQGDGVDIPGTPAQTSTPPA